MNAAIAAARCAGCTYVWANDDFVRANHVRPKNPAVHHAHLVHPNVVLHNAASISNQIDINRYKLNYSNYSGPQEWADNQDGHLPRQLDLAVFFGA